MKKTIIALLLTLPLIGQAANRVILTKTNTLVMNKVFDGESVAKLIKEAKELDSSIWSSDPIYLVINSPGGSIDAGIELIENLSNLNRPVKTINLFSASMGFQTAQGLGERLITKDGTLMSHKARGGFEGEFPGQLDSRYNYYLKRITRLDQKAADRTKGKHTLQSYRDLTENEYWCDGLDCLSQGFVDRVIQARCDSTLKGTSVVAVGRFTLMGMSIEVNAEMDNCPLNTNALEYVMLVDGQELFPKKKDGLLDYFKQAPKLNLSNESIFEINKTANELIRNHKLKKVVRGY